MNYRYVYMCLIAHAKSEENLGIRVKGNGNYYERHHILPRSLFSLWTKRKSNIVLLTAREHFFCHQLLIKIYPTPQMFCALKFLATDNQNNYCSSKEYERIKHKISCEIKEYVKQKRKEFLDNPEKSAYFRECASKNMKKTITPESRKIGIEKSRITCKSESYRKKRSEQTRKFFENHPEYRNKHSEVVKEWMNSHPEYRKEKSNQMKSLMSDPIEKEKRLQGLKDWRNSEKGRDVLSENGRKSAQKLQKLSLEYKKYKSKGGTLLWNDFRKNYKNIVNI